MIFVHPETDAEPLEQWFAEIEPHIGPHQPELLSEYEAGRARHEIAANWKITVENFIDAYHLSHLHAETLFICTIIAA
jgi:phenylpropionate dioxygenase-like ring-hydroxylating dioxygenase large terminal subunit